MTRLVNIARATAAMSLLALASSASAQPKPPKAAQERACFFPRDINSFHAANDHTVYLRVGTTDYYRLDLLGSCPNLDFALGVGFRAYRGATTICSPQDAELIVRLQGAIPNYCPVQAMHKLDAGEVALLGKNKP
jgi:hypothetical protein